MKELKRFWKIECKRSLVTMLIVIFRLIIFKLIFKKKILAHPRATIKGLKNIKSYNWLRVGLSNTEFSHFSDVTFLNIRGKLLLKGSYSIGRGCRVDIGPEATLSIGVGGYLNSNTTIIIKHGLTIGDNCVISWNCQFLDDDFHEINYAERRILSSNEIIIGNNVWIGCGVKIYKGTIIPDGSVIASDSVVRGRFEDKSILIAGNPAKIIKRNITWN